MHISLIVRVLTIIYLTYKFTGIYCKKWAKNYLLFESYQKIDVTLNETLDIRFSDGSNH